VYPVLRPTLILKTGHPRVSILFCINFSSAIVFIAACKA
jgi:hypothetical protein